MLVELLDGLRARRFGKMLCQDCKQRITDQGHVSQSVGIARARAVLTKQDVTSPVISHLHPRPMPPY